MDLKTFADSDFDSKKWINRAWSSSGSQDKEIFVTNTVSRLQLYMKQLTNSLDEITTQIVTSIPRVLQDASALQLEGAMLQNKMLALEQKVRDVEEETGHSIESLQRIDQLKSRLENAASALREADKWAALVTSLEDTLDSGVPTKPELLTEITERVAALTASLEVLNEAPDYEAKQLQLETLYNRLEAAVSGPLVDALTQMDSDRTKTYVELFTAMCRGESVRNWWIRGASGTAVREWSQLETPSLSALRDNLARDAHKQLEWLSDILNSETPLRDLVKLYTDVLMSLEPSPSKIITANIKLCSTPQEGITFLMDVRNELDQFIATFATLLESSKESVNETFLKELGRAIYSPLRELLPKYTDLQTQVFTQYFDNKDLEQDDLLDRSRAFQTLVERSEGWLKTSHSSARKIAENAIYPYYVPAVEAFAASLNNHISGHIRRIEASFLSSPSPSGVLSATFPAALALGAAVGMLLDTLAATIEDVNGEMAKEEQPKPSPLHDVIAHLLDDSGKQRLASLLDAADPIASVTSIRRSGVTLRTLAVNILKEPVLRQLEKIPTLSVWSNNDALSTDLPDYSLSPQEYITEVGQYLMTLPQHLEMHLPEKQAPWQFLTEVCNHTCEMYAEKILTVRNMDALGTKRCLTDIVYLSSVVEDLGSTITPALKNLEKSLRAAAPVVQTQN